MSDMERLLLAQSGRSLKDRRPKSAKSEVRVPCSITSSAAREA
jgi:hypothetical protein